MGIKEYSSYNQTMKKCFALCQNVKFTLGRALRYNYYTIYLPQKSYEFENEDEAFKFYLEKFRKLEMEIK